VTVTGQDPAVAPVVSTYEELFEIEQIEDETVVV
jgi:hypothetical protein